MSVTQVSALETFKAGQKEGWKHFAPLETSDPARLEKFRQEYEALAAESFEDNRVRQGYLMTRAIKT
jgi:hypothetical protein